MTAILVATMSFLMTTPFLRTFTDQLVQLVNQQERMGWDNQLAVPPKLSKQVQKMKSFMESCQGRKLRGKTLVRELHSYSPNSIGWG